VTGNLPDVIMHTEFQNNCTQHKIQRAKVHRARGQWHLR